MKIRILAAILCGAMLGPGGAPGRGRGARIGRSGRAGQARRVRPRSPGPRSSTSTCAGFAFRTPDRLFELAIGFNLQLRFTHFDFDRCPTPLSDADEFRVRRFKLYFTGYAFDPRLTYRVQLAFENVNNTRLLLDDAWVNYKFMDEISAQMGQSKTPYSRDELYNDGVIQFQERALAVDTFKPGRDTGAGILGSLFGGKMTYMAGVFSGDGQNTLRATDHVMPVVRLVANPIGQMTGRRRDGPRGPHGPRPLFRRRRLHEHPAQDHGHRLRSSHRQLREPDGLARPQHRALHDRRGRLRRVGERRHPVQVAGLLGAGANTSPATPRATRAACACAPTAGTARPASS